jgi:hypothetical protein
MTEYLDKEKLCKVLDDTTKYSWTINISDLRSLIASEQLDPDPITVTLGDGTTAKVGDTVMTAASRIKVIILAVHRINAWCEVHSTGDLMTVQLCNLEKYVEPDSWEMLAEYVDSFVEGDTIFVCDVQEVFDRAKDLAGVDK